MKYLSICLVIGSLIFNQISAYSDYEEEVAWYFQNLPEAERQMELAELFGNYDESNENLSVDQRLSPSSNTVERDQEHIEQGSIHGVDHPQYTSGGAGEGSQHLKPEGTVKNKNQVKSDAKLPFYCPPPNPCPKGFTAEKNNCDENVKDVDTVQMEFVQSEMSSGKCSCDGDHMFNCPQNPSSQLGGVDLKANIAALLGENKHESLIAKKAPRMLAQNDLLTAESMS